MLGLVSAEVIAGIVSAATAVAALGWGVYVWRRDHRDKARAATEAADRRQREAEAAEARRHDDAARREAERRSHLSVELVAGVRGDWETKRNRPGDIGTTHLIPGAYLNLR